MEPIRIVRDDIELNLSDDFQMEYSDTLALYDEDSINQPITVGGTANLDSNQRFFGYIGSLIQVEPLVNFPVTVDKGPISFQQAYMEVETINQDENGKQVVDFNIYLHGAAEELADQKWNQVDMGTIDLGIDIVQSMKDWNASAERIMRFPMYVNRSQYGSSNNQFGANGFANTQAFINAWDPIGASFPENDFAANKFSYGICPWLHLTYAMTAAFKAQGWNISGEFFDDPDIQKMLLVNNTTLDHMTMNGPSTELNWPNSFPAPNAPSRAAFQEILQDDDSITDIATNTLTFPFQGTYTIRCLINSDVSFRTLEFRNSDNVLVHDQICFNGVTNITTFNIGPSEVNEPLYISITDFPDIQSMQIAIQGGAVGHNGFERIIEYRHHVPDMTLTELLVKLKNAFGLNVKVSPFARNIRLDFIKDDLNSNESQAIPYMHDSLIINRLPNRAVSLIPSLRNGELKKLPPGSTAVTVDFFGSGYVPGDLLYSRIENAYYAAKWDKDEQRIKREYICENIEPYILGNGKETMERDLDMSLLPMRMIRLDTITEYALVPVMSEQGSSLDLSMGMNPSSDLTLITWHGLQAVWPDTSTNTYPLASTYNMNALGNEIGNFNFAPTDDSFSITSLHKKLMRSLAQQEQVEFRSLLDFVKAITIDRYKPLFLNGKRILLTERSLTLDDNSEVDVQFTGLAIRP
jgi:hypothetical protein